MPIPGPRTQTGPLPGYRNPWDESPDKFNHWFRPPPVEDSGRTPGTMFHSLRGNVLAPGQIRRLWNQTVDMVAAQAGYSWTRSAPAPGRPMPSPGGLGITTALRYMARSTYAAGGTDNTRFGALHTQVRPHARGKAVSTAAGSVRSRPTIRNRMTSFGSRVTPINAKVPAAK